MKHYRWHWIAVIALLAALWATLELTVGLALVALHAPLRGHFFVLLTLPLMFAARLLVPKRGSVFALGCTAAAVRGLLGGAFLPQISLAIVMEALLVELSLGAVNGGLMPRWKMALSGGFCMVYTALHPILLFGIILGGGRGVKLPVGATGLVIFAGLLFVHFIVGAIAGIWAGVLLRKIPRLGLQTAIAKSQPPHPY